jgi:hypothetical protein
MENAQYVSIYSHFYPVFIIIIIVIVVVVSFFAYLHFMHNTLPSPLTLHG